MLNAQMDFIGKGAAQGELAGYLAAQGRIDPGHMRPWLGRDNRVYVTVYSGGDPKKKESYRNIPLQTNAIQTNSTLRRDEWKSLDEAVLAASRTRLNGVQDLIANGLTYNLGNAMGTTVLEYHSISDAMEAALTMDGVTRGKGDRPNYETHYLPIPIIHVDYEINARVLAASRSLGNPLDTTMAEQASRKVSEMLENMLFTDTTYGFGGGTIYSYLNHPHRNLATLGTAWTADTASNILADVFTMKQASIDAKHYGPWMLYIPTAYEVLMDKDYDSTTATGRTIRERILQIEGIKGVKVIDTLPTGNVLLVQMTSDVVRLVSGMGIQSVQWDTEGKFVSKFKVLTIQVPQIRADQDGNSGIVHLS
jgi:hypothetical protein